MWPLYEVEDGKFKFTVKPKERVPVANYLKAQGRFRHLTDDEIAELQEITDKEYDDFEALEKVYE